MTKLRAYSRQQLSNSNTMIPPVTYVMAIPCVRYYANLVTLCQTLWACIKGRGMFSSGSHPFQ